MIYSLTLEELMWRPIIRSDYNDEWLNKMTDDEIRQFNKEVEEIISKLPLEEQYFADTSLIVDRNILYKIFMIDKPRQERIKKLDSL